jgi:hypothetical protein
VWKAGKEKPSRIVVSPDKSYAWEYFDGPCQGKPRKLGQEEFYMKLGQEEFYIWKKLKKKLSQRSMWRGYK